MRGITAVHRKAKREREQRIAEKQQGEFNHYVQRDEADIKTVRQTQQGSTTQAPPTIGAIPALTFFHDFTIAFGIIIHPLSAYSAAVSPLRTVAFLRASAAAAAAAAIQARLLRRDAEAGAPRVELLQQRRPTLQLDSKL